jgi:hypothetical protein
MRDVTIGRCIGRRRAYTLGTITPNLLKLGGGDVGAVVGGDGSPKVLAAGFVDGAQAVCIHYLGLMRYFSVDA